MSWRPSNRIDIQALRCVPLHVSICYSSKINILCPILHRDHDKTEGNQTTFRMQDSKPNKKQTTTEENHLHLTLRFVHTKPQSNHQAQLNLNDILATFVHTFTVDR